MEYFSLEVFKKHDKYSVNSIELFVESRRMKSIHVSSFSPDIHRAKGVMYVVERVRG